MLPPTIAKPTDSFPEYMSGYLVSIPNASDKFLRTSVEDGGNIIVNEIKITGTIAAAFWISNILAFIFGIIAVGTFMYLVYYALNWFASESKHIR